MQLDTLSFSWIAIIAFSLFILVGNPLILMIILGILGYTKRTGFLVGLTVAQVSEFTFIMIALGVKVGDLPQDILSFATVVGMITIAISTYMIMYSDALYAFFEPYLGIFERKGKKVETQRSKKTKPYDIILFGYNKMGYDLLDSFKKLKKKYLIVDYDPETILALKKEGYACEYGDAEDLELLEELNIGKVQMIISTIPSVRINNTLITKARDLNKKAVVIVVSHHIEEAIQLYKAGATYVVMPHMVGGSHTSNMIKKYGVDVTKFFQERTAHIKILRQRAKQHNIRKIKELYKKYFKGQFKQ